MADYDRNNIFARILRGELPCKKVHEDAFALAFHDIHPLAPVHVLVIPKAVAKVARDLGLEPEGYRIVANHGPNGGQLVFHFHVHVFGGRPMSHRMGNMPRPGDRAGDKE